MLSLLWYSIYVALLNRSRNKISYQLTARLSLTSIPWRRGQHQFARLLLLPERMATQQTSSLPWNKRTKDLREISYLGVNKVVNATLKKYRRYLLPVLLVAALPLLTFISSGSTPTTTLLSYDPSYPFPLWPCPLHRVRAKKPNFNKCPRSISLDLLPLGFSVVDTSQVLRLVVRFTYLLYKLKTLLIKSSDERIAVEQLPSILQHPVQLITK